MKKRKAQNMIEYLLIAILVAIASLAVVSKFDFKAIRNYVFSRPTAGDTSQITIEPMTRRDEK